MKAVFNHTDDIALNIRTFWFRPDEKLDFTAGQYLRWYLPHDSADERGERRWFTISSSPTELPLISLTTKLAADQPSSFKTALKKLKPGDGLEFTGPIGDFVLPKDKNLKLVFVAGGIGVTPFRSIIKYLLDSGERREIELIYAANQLGEVAFQELFMAYGLKPVLVLGQPPEGWQGETGRLDGQRILELTGGPADKIYYFSGPEPMVEVMVNDTKKHGLPESQIVTDFFPGYKVI